MDPLESLPPSISSQAIAVWKDVAESLTAGDIDKLTQAIKDFIELSPTDKRTIEDMATTLPYPGLPPQLITEIFTNPEVSIGVIERLGSESNEEAFIKELGTSEQALVLDALITWLKSEQHISQSIAKATSSQNSDSTTETANNATKTTVVTNIPTGVVGASVAGGVGGKIAAGATGTNPLNLALQNFIEKGTAFTNGPLDLSSLQFLKSNAISLAGLQIADPTLLSKAYEIASQQLLISLLPEINTPVTGSEQARSNVIQHELVDSIRKALQDSAIPLNMQTFLVLWTAMSLPTIKEQISTEQVTNKPVEATIEGMKSATGTLPSSPIVASVLASFPALFAEQNSPTVLTLVDQLGMLSYIYSQMAPYWSGPAAVSLMTQKGVELSDQAKTESAVRAFAIALGALLNDPTFDKILAFLISTKLANLSQEQLKTFIAAMKVSILMNALVALNIVLMRKLQGQFRADELAKLILGPTLEEKTEIDDLQSGLIKAIQVELENIPKEKREKLIYSLLSTYSNDTDVNALIDPTKQFLNLIDPSISIDQASNTKG